MVAWLSAHHTREVVAQQRLAAVTRSSPRLKRASAAQSQFGNPCRPLSKRPSKPRRGPEPTEGRRGRLHAPVCGAHIATLRPTREGWFRGLDVCRFSRGLGPRNGTLTGLDSALHWSPCLRYTHPVHRPG